MLLRFKQDRGEVSLQFWAISAVPSRVERVGLHARPRLIPSRARSMGPIRVCRIPFFQPQNGPAAISSCIRKMDSRDAEQGNERYKIVCNTVRT